MLQLVRERRLRLPDDPELVDELVNLRVRELSPGVYRTDHDELVNGLNGLLSIACGANHTLGRLNTGGLRGWGANTSGQLGNGATTNPNIVPVKVNGLS